MNELDFLANMMSKLGFHVDWITLIMRCVCSVSYTVGVNKGTSEYFSLFRGLNQRDPLSPYLFLLWAKGFSAMLDEAKQKGTMKGVKIGWGGLTINHLFFADRILFGDASEEEAYLVRRIILEYESTNDGGTKEEIGFC